MRSREPPPPPSTGCFASQHGAGSLGNRARGEAGSARSPPLRGQHCLCSANHGAHTPSPHPSRLPSCQGRVQAFKRPEVQSCSEPHSWGLEQGQTMCLSSLGACCGGFTRLPALPGEVQMGRAVAHGEQQRCCGAGAWGWHLCPASLTCLCKERTCMEFSCHYPL